MPFDRIKYAGLAWPILIQRAAGQRTITYGELAEHLHIHHRQCRLFLELLQNHCIENQLPPLTSLVIGKSSGLPGHGFLAWDIEDAATARDLVFGFDWSSLNNPFDFAAKGESYASLAKRLLKPAPDWKAVYQLVESRGALQTVFREALMQAYGRKCAMSDCRSEELLQAAHILPWSECTPEERMDVRNGILVASTYHHMFDLDWLRISSDYRILPGPEIPPSQDRGRFESAIIGQVLTFRLRLPSEPRFHPNPEYIRRRYED